MTTNKLVKLMMLWTTGPWTLDHEVPGLNPTGGGIQLCTALHCTVFHYHPFIISIWLKSCWYMWNAPVVQSRRPLTYRLVESVGPGGPKWHGSSWQRGIAESGSSRLSTLMIDVPGDLVWDLPCVQQASYLEGGPLMWMLPLYLHVNQKDIKHQIIFNLVEYCNHHFLKEDNFCYFKLFLKRGLL